MSLLTDLECGRCGLRHVAERLQNECSACNGPLFCRYDERAPGRPTLADVLRRPPGQYRLAERMPTRAGAATPTLGEGATPLIPAAGLAADLGLPQLWIKDEAQNPTASFKARGMSTAMARARELGAEAVCLPSAGNAAAAAAAYGALHGLEVHVTVPEATPEPILHACRAHGAHLTRVPGSIAEAGTWIAAQAREQGWFSLATLREPYRVEGKKVMGYELVYDLGRMPDVILYPTGGGTGLIGMARAADEMGRMGWIGDQRPRFVCVQMSGCAPLVRAFDQGAASAEPWADPEPSAAFGLRVPSARGDFAILDILRRSGGTAVAVSEQEMAAGCERMAVRLGLWPGPEGGACVAAAAKLRARDWLRPDDLVVLFNTGSPYPYQS